MPGRLAVGTEQGLVQLWDLPAFADDPAARAAPLKVRGLAGPPPGKK